MGAPLVASDIRDYLVNTVGLTSVTIDMLSPDPINQYAVVEYAGPANVKTHGGANPGGVVLDQAHIQIMARHKSAATARTNIMAVVDALDGLRDVTIGSVVYTYITAINRPRMLDREEDGGIVFIAEFWVQARR